MHNWQHHPVRPKEWKCTGCGAEAIFRPDDNVGVVRIHGLLVTNPPSVKLGVYRKSDILPPNTMDPLQPMTCEEASRS
jgi:hypothetical protein